MSSKDTSVSYLVIGNPWHFATSWIFFLLLRRRRPQLLLSSHPFTSFHLLLLFFSALRQPLPFYHKGPTTSRNKTSKKKKIQLSYYLPNRRACNNFTLFIFFKCTTYFRNHVFPDFVFFCPDLCLSVDGVGIMMTIPHPVSSCAHLWGLEGGCVCVCVCVVDSRRNVDWQLFCSCWCLFCHGPPTRWEFGEMSTYITMWGAWPPHFFFWKKKWNLLSSSVGSRRVLLLSPETNKRLAFGVWENESLF